MDDIIKKIIEFNYDRNWNKFHTPKNLVMAITSEIGELSDLYRWKKERESLSELEYNSVCEEISDIFIFLFTLCDKLDLDEYKIKKMIDFKIIKNSIKYPITNKLSKLHEKNIS